MKSFIHIVSKYSKVMSFVGGAILVLMMLVTVIDVILRRAGTPIPGTYELMGFCGALVVGFALAQTTLDDAHVTMDIITDKLPEMRKNVLLITTKIACIILFALISWALFMKGYDLQKGREVSLTLRVPFYPVAYALSVCSFLECMALLSDIFRIAMKGGKHE